MNVTFYVFIDEDGGSRDVVSTGTFTFDKSALQQGQFRGEWILSGVGSANTVRPLAEDYLGPLSGRGVFDATRVDGTWILTLQQIIDDAIRIELDSMSDQSWDGKWTYETYAGYSDWGAFEAVKAGG